MLAYALQRIALALLICTVAITALIGLIHVIPGDPIIIMLGPRATPEMREAKYKEMGMDRPVPVQIALFLGKAATGDLGNDMWSKRPVTVVVAETLPYTLSLIAAGLGWAIVLGIPLGCYSAVRRNSAIDKLTGVISVGTISIPSFVVAIYAMLVFAVKLQWFPAIGAGDRGDLADQAHHLVLPAFAMGLGWVGYLARLVRASMLEIMGEQHVRTARAFGLPERSIIFGYALRIAILPTITLISLAFGTLLSSAVFTEVIFARPGIGKLIVDAVNFRNYPVVMGTVFVTVTMFSFGTMLADLLIARLDPRVRSGL
ncbi:MAG TPA: ABC transporter permease [Dongiaceae bacterium]|jgi:peptide/nickel transport system permease protein